MAKIDVVLHLDHTDDGGDHTVAASIVDSFDNPHLEHYRFPDKSFDSEEDLWAYIKDFVEDNVICEHYVQISAIVLTDEDVEDVAPAGSEDA